MPLDKLPVPTLAELQLQTTDVGSVFQGKMNAAVIALRNALIAYNNQIDAALTASQQVEPAPFDVAVAGENNSYKMTPLRVRQAMQSFGIGLNQSADMRAMPVVDYSGGVDFNTLKNPGWYKVLVNSNISSNGPPIPATGSGYWYVQILEFAGGQALLQRCHTYMTHGAAGNSPGAPYTFERAYFFGVWADKWQAVGYPMVGTVGFDTAHQANVGAVIEHGSNPNGEYSKLADGTLICLSKPLILSASASNSMVGIFAFPAIFAAQPQVSFQLQTASAVWSPSLPLLSGQFSELGVSSSALVVQLASAQTVSVSGVYASAIGRWR